MKKNEFTAVIIDDEKLARDLIKNYLGTFNNIKIIAECKNGFEGIDAITKFSPDLIFLDIQMPKLNGFEMLELLDAPQNIIFTTAYDEYAIKAFEVNAVDYLLKPFSLSRFSEAVNKALSSSGTKNNTDGLIATSVFADEKLNRIVVKKGEKIIIIPINEINYFEAQDDYVKIVTASGFYLKQNRMKYYEKRLPDNFVRIHRSYIVNLDSIKEINPQKNETTLNTGENIPVSKSGYTRLKEKIK